MTGELSRTTVALHESEEKYRTLFEASLDAILLETLDGRVLDCNSAACALYGYPRESLIGLSVRDLVPPEVARDLPEPASEGMLRDGISLEAAQRRRDGTVFPAEVSARLIRLHGEPLIITYVRDVSARRQAEDARRESEARFRTLVENLPIGVYRSTPGSAGRFLMANPAFLKMFGIASETQLRELAVRDVYANPQERADFSALVTAQGSLTGFELRLKKLDGTPLWGSITARAVCAEPGGPPQYFDCSIEDVTARKRAEQAGDVAYRISEDAHAAQNLDELYYSIHRLISALMPARNFYLALYDARADLVHFPYFVDEEDPAAPPLHLGHGLTAFVVRTGKPLLVSRAEYDRLVASGEIEAIGTPAVSWLGVPLTTRAGTIGALVVQSYAEGLSFTHADQDMLLFVSEQVAMAIERKRAEETLRRREAILQAVGFAADQFLRSPDWEQSVQTVLARLGEAGNVSRVYVFENHAGPDGRLRMSQRYEWAAPGIAPQQDNPALQDLPYVSRGYGRWVDVLGAGETIYGHVRDFPETEQGLFVAQHILSLAVVPIYVGAAWWGFIGFDECQVEREWFPADLDALKAAAGTLGAAMQRERTEEARAQERNLLRTLIDNLPDHIYAKDLATRLILSNVANARVTGAGSPDEILGKSDFEFYPRDLAERYYADDQTVLRTGQPMSNREEPIVDPAGEQRWILTTKVPLFGGRGEVTGLVGIGRDITAHKRRERELQALVAVAAALRGAPTFAEMTPAVVDQIVDLLKAESVVLFLRDQVTGELVVDRATGSSQGMEGVRLAMGEGLSGEVLRTGEVYVDNEGRPDARVRRPADVAPARASACVPLIAYEQRVGVVWITRDTPFQPDELRLLTAIADIAANALYRSIVMSTLEQHVTERTRELAAANERLQELDRLKSKFVSDVSHELRTPLTNLKLYLNLVEHGRPEKQPQYLGVIREQVDRLSYLIEAILDLSHLESGRRLMEMAPTDLNAVVAQVAAEQRARAEVAGLALVVVADPDLPLVRGDRQALLQVVSNLVTNAISYTSAGTVTLRTLPARECGRACFEVQDTGMGIEREDLPHVFERFYRGRHLAQSNLPGTGLGLAIVKELVELHAGRVEVESAAGQGSTFRVWLPLAEFDD